MISPQQVEEMIKVQMAAETTIKLQWFHRSLTARDWYNSTS